MLRSKDMKENVRRNAGAKEVVMTYEDYKNDADKYFVVMSLPLTSYLKMRKFEYEVHLDIKSNSVFYVFERSTALRDAVMDWNVGLFKVFANTLADTKQEAINVKEMETIKHEQGLM